MKLLCCHKVIGRHGRLESRPNRQAGKPALLRMLVGLAIAGPVAASGQNTDRQAADGQTTSGQTTNGPPESAAVSSAKAWSFTASVYGFIVPESRDYVNPNFTADHGWLHLEARYNYEALDTASLWVGYNFSFGKELVFDIAPMVGGIFGDLKGVAPGYTLSLSYKGFALSSQSEYVFDADDSSGNFFYTWSELSYAPLDWLRAGLVAQRTKAYKSDLDIQRGFLVGVSYKKVEFTTYVFNLGWTDPTVVLAVGLSF
jgi:hypothetical protein